MHWKLNEFRKIRLNYSHTLWQNAIFSSELKISHILHICHGKIWHSHKRTNYGKLWRRIAIVKSGDIAYDKLFTHCGSWQYFYRLIIDSLFNIWISVKKDALKRIVACSYCYLLGNEWRRWKHRKTNVT